MSDTSIDNPILNSPYEAPERYFEIGHNGPTGEIREGRRPSESFIPIPAPKKGKGQAAEQQGFDFDVTGERIERNSLINDIRFEVERWRARNYQGVTPISRKLLLHWADRSREDRVLWCQREAAETAVFLAEVAGRHNYPDYRARLEEPNKLHNEGLPRVGLKMATGAGKTVVMGMLIAWQTLNKVFSPNDARFTKRFLVVTPGITIKNRLRVLHPDDAENYYDLRGLVPPDLRSALQEAQVSITNYHAFLLKDAKEIQGVSATTRRILNAGKQADPFKESPDQMVARVLRDLSGRGKGEIMVLNDEAHHCYRDRPLEDTDLGDAESRKEAAQRNEDARVWYRGLQAVQRKVGIKTIYDLSATPFYLRGSGYNEGYIFPWVVSDFSLMDAIESGIVKVPQVPVDDDAAGDLVTYLRLWDYVGKELPKRKPKDADDGRWTPPEALEGALASLYRHYARDFADYEQRLAPHGEPPPVFIVVCPNTTVSKLVYDWIAGQSVEGPEGDPVLRPGELPLLSNVRDGGWLDRPRTILIDSAALESGEALSAEFKAAAALEIDRFKAEYRNRHAGADVDKLTDEDILREVMNTVGKPGTLGEHVRCVVSVSMLTEGWDANTVTHILGIRRFGSQLLCEQVAGRGLRRRSYEPNAEGFFEPEYAMVYGVPFAFIPSDRPTADAKPKSPAVLVEAVPDRYDLRITFPKLDGYRIEMPDEHMWFDADAATPLHVDRNEVAVWVKAQGVVGQSVEVDLDEYRHARPQEVAFRIARTLVQRQFAAHDEAPRPWLFPRLVDFTRQWLDSCVTYGGDAFVGLLMPAEACHRAAEAVFNSISGQQGNRPEIVQPILRRFDPEGSTDDVSFLTRKVVIEATKSHVSHVVLDGPKGNTWEQILSLLCEQRDTVAAYVKNDHLGFFIPYVHEGRSHHYVPDFLVRLVPEDDDVTRTLIIEVSGGLKSPGPTKAKAATARDQWCTAVNNHGGFGRWGYVEITDMPTAAETLDAAIDSLYADGPVIGQPA